MERILYENKKIMGLVKETQSILDLMLEHLEKNLNWVKQHGQEASLESDDEF